MFIFNGFGPSSERMDSLRRRANAENISFRISLRWAIHIINSVDKTKLSSRGYITLLIIFHNSEIVTLARISSLLGETECSYGK